MWASAEPQSSRLIFPEGLNKRVPEGKVAVVQAELECLSLQFLKEVASHPDCPRVTIPSSMSGSSSVSRPLFFNAFICHGAPCGHLQRRYLGA